MRTLIVVVMIQIQNLILISQMRMTIQTTAQMMMTIQTTTQMMGTIQMTIQMMTAIQMMMTILGHKFGQDHLWTLQI